MSRWADNFNEWRFTICWLGDPTSTTQASVEDLYQAFKARMQKEALEAAHPSENCPARTGGNSCIC